MRQLPNDKEYVLVVLVLASSWNPRNQWKVLRIGILNDRIIVAMTQTVAKRPLYALIFDSFWFFLSDLQIVFYSIIYLRLNA